MEIRTAEGDLEGYVFAHVGDGSKSGFVKESFASKPGVAFVGQFVGAFSLFGRVLASELSELQTRIEDDYWDAGVRSEWSLNLTGYRVAAPKRASPDICALVRVRAKADPFDVIERLDEQFLDSPYGAAVVTGSDFDMLVDLGADTVEDVLDRVLQLRAIPGVGHTATAIADLANNAIRPESS
jgi:hypothetical protein